MPYKVGLRCIWWCDNLVEVSVTSLFEIEKKSYREFNWREAGNEEKMATTSMGCGWRKLTGV